MNNEALILTYSFLMKHKQHLELMPYESEKELLYLLDDYRLTGFINESVIFDKDSLLKRRLEINRRDLIIKHLSMRTDLKIITSFFSKKGIEFIVVKGMAMNHLELYKTGIRFCRDIDILVSREDVPKAYEALRFLGYGYFNPDTLDKADFFSGKHLPEMINQNKTIVELHHRLTDPKDFEVCPLTEALTKEQNINLFKDVKIPSKDFLIAHAIYHGIKAHKMRQGPIFLFDVKQLYLEKDRRWPADLNLFGALGIISSFHYCKNLIELMCNTDHFPSSLANNIDSLIKDIEKINNPKERWISIQRFKNLLSNIRNRYWGTMNLYQRTPFSFKYWYFFVRDIIRRINKL